MFAKRPPGSLRISKLGGVPLLRDGSSNGRLVVANSDPYTVFYDPTTRVQLELVLIHVLQCSRQLEGSDHGAEESYPEFAILTSKLAFPDSAEPFHHHHHHHRQDLIIGPSGSERLRRSS